MGDIYSGIIQNYKTSRVCTSYGDSALGSVDTDPILFGVLFWVVGERVAQEPLMLMPGPAVMMEQAMLEQGNME